jgi:hypothetical protein
MPAIDADDAPSSARHGHRWRRLTIPSSGEMRKMAETQCESEIERSRPLNDLGREPVPGLADFPHPFGYRFTIGTARPERRDTRRRRFVSGTRHRGTMSSGNIDQDAGRDRGSSLGEERVWARSKRDRKTKTSGPPLVDPGNPSDSAASRAKAHPTRLYHRLVALAPSPSSSSAKKRTSKGNHDCNASRNTEPRRRRRVLQMSARL